MKKVWINPNTPKFMDFKDISERSQSHLNKWWGRAFIRTDDFGNDTYAEYCNRMAYTQEEDYQGDYELETEEEFNARRAEDYNNWCKRWGDDGIRYDVRCLDGGAWDRTTNKGSYKTLEEAMDVAMKINNNASFRLYTQKNLEESK